MSSTVAILDVPFARATPAQALDLISELYERDGPALVFHANVHTVNLAYNDRSYREVLRSADVVLNDGKGMMLAARILGQPFPADLNGNFMTPLVLQRAAEEGWPVFFFGAKPGVADRAAASLQGRYEGLDVVGVRNGYFTATDVPEILQQIRDAGTGLLVAGMGNPMQERWLHGNIDKTGARLGIGVGAFFDFQTGEIQRAPAWMNRIGLEWVHRLVLEPRRMWRRYLLGNPAFVARVLRRRLRGGAGG